MAGLLLPDFSSMGCDLGVSVRPLSCLKSNTNKIDSSRNPPSQWREGVAKFKILASWKNTYLCFVLFYTIPSSTFIFPLAVSFSRIQEEVTETQHGAEDTGQR